MKTKDKVLDLFLHSNGKNLSGEFLAQQCNVSRSAIWKAINILRQDGCIIQGSPKVGYVFANSDYFSKEVFLYHLQTGFPELFSESLPYVECFSDIDSTNAYAKGLLAKYSTLRLANGELSKEGKKFHNSVYLAESQSSGRGRLGRSFFSPKKTGVYFSMISVPKGGVTHSAIFTTLAAVAVCKSLESLCKIQPKIKWINDIFAGGKKICGILTEGITNFETGLIESLVIGIGINIYNPQEQITENLWELAGSIKEAGGNDCVSRCALAAEVVGWLIKLSNTDEDEILSEYKKYSFLIGKEVTVYPIIDDEKSSYSAKVLDIDNQASLVVQLQDGSVKTLSSGEVTLKSSCLV